MPPSSPVVRFYWRDDPARVLPLLDRIRQSGELAVVGTWTVTGHGRRYCAWRDGERVLMPWGSGRIPGMYESAEAALLALRGALAEQG